MALAFSVSIVANIVGNSFRSFASYLLIVVHLSGSAQFHILGQCGSSDWKFFKKDYLRNFSSLTLHNLANSSMSNKTTLEWFKEALQEV
jgi:hypothetical protein